jgi:hypothetical protein
MGLMILVLTAGGTMAEQLASPQKPIGAVGEGPDPAGHENILERRFGQYAKPLAELQAAVGAQKKTASSYRDTVWPWLQWTQLLIIVLGAIATAVVAVGNRLPAVAPWAIVPTTAVTILTGAISFYDFPGEYGRLSDLRASLAELQSRIEIDISLADAAVAPGQPVTSLSGESLETYIRARHKELRDLLDSDHRRRRIGRSAGQ